MNAIARNWGVKRGPVYVPTIHGDKTICELETLPRVRTRAQRKRWAFFKRWEWAAFLLGVAFCAMCLGYGATLAWNLYAANSEHHRACALPVHTNPSCGNS
jgi:hypothetical protein